MFARSDARSDSNLTSAAGLVQRSVFPGWLKPGMFRAGGLLLLLAAFPSTVWAQAKETVEGAPKSFAPNYLLLILLIALVMLVVCKPSGRQPDVKPRYN